MNFRIAVVAAFAISAGLSVLRPIPGYGQDTAPQSAAKPSGVQEGQGGCDSFTWDVSHELDVLAKPAKAVAAGADGKKPVRLELDQHYSVKLLPQSTVKFAAR